jgi:hypothetical protein
MSKSENNGVDPHALIASHGADTARMFVMFAGPPEESALWSDSGVEGAHRFLKRLWAYAQGLSDVLARSPTPIDWAHAPPAHRVVRRELHLVLKQADYDYRRVQYNTVVSAGMKMLNALEAAPFDATAASIELAREGLSLLLRVLNPVVPHITHALWEDLGYAVKHGDIVEAPWPEVDAAALAQAEIELVLQVNGKLRGKLTVAASADTAAIEAAAIASAPVQRALAESNGAGDVVTTPRVIVVPNRLVNVLRAPKSTRSRFLARVPRPEPHPLEATTVWKEYQKAKEHKAKAVGARRKRLAGIALGVLAVVGIVVAIVALVLRGQGEQSLPSDARARNDFVDAQSVKRSDDEKRLLTRFLARVQAQEAAGGPAPKVTIPKAIELQRSYDDDVAQAQTRYQKQLDAAKADVRIDVRERSIVRKIPPSPRPASRCATPWTSTTPASA